MGHDRECLTRTENGILPAGMILRNRYRIDARFGRGGMGAVCRALDLHLNTRIAIKENLECNTSERTPRSQRGDRLWQAPRTDTNV
jgi:hypothetical protein